jgi:two-component system OmpR family response regulator
MGRILVADSDPNVLLLCHDELREEGYEVLVASNAREALGLLDQACPDLVVLEIMLPDLSGFETLNIIKGTCRQTPVIFHSTYGLPQDVRAGQVDGVVLKTHNLDSLKATVRRFLPIRRPGGNSPRQPKFPAAIPYRHGAYHGYNGN